MRENVKVSVIIPVYNAEDYLEQCLMSVITQTLTDIEIICVDDGSTDASLQILETFASRDRRLRVLHQENKYAGCARNLGMAHAGGKYLVFWDADDFFDAEALEKMYNTCERDQADLCVCDVTVLDDESGQSYSGLYLATHILPDHIPFDRDDAAEYLFNFGTNNPWNKMFRRAYIQERDLQFQPLRQSNDAFFVMMAMFYAKRMTVVKEQLVTYRKGNDTSLTGQTSRNRYCVTEALRAVYRELSASEDFSPEIRKSFVNKAFSMMRYSLRNQTDWACYEELFVFYKEELFPELGMEGLGVDDIYGMQNKKDFEQIMNGSAQMFLLHEFRKLDRKSPLTAGRLRDTSIRLSDLRKRFADTQEQLKETRRQLQKVSRRLDLVENSTSYKVGQAVTLVPRTIKDKVKGKKSV